MPRARESHFEVRVRVMPFGPKRPGWPELIWVPAAELTQPPEGDRGLRYELPPVTYRGPLIRRPGDPDPEPVERPRVDVLFPAAVI